MAAVTERRELVVTDEGVVCEYEWSDGRSARMMELADGRVIAYDEWAQEKHASFPRPRSDDPIQRLNARIRALRLGFELELVDARVKARRTAIAASAAAVGVAVVIERVLPW